jgi:phage-related tail fiber protein
MGIQINGQTDNISAVDGSLSVDGTLNVTGNITGDGTVPPGTLIFHCGNTAPAGFLKANGATISRSTYADLFAALGTTFGAGNGSTTFNLPDLRGEFPRGWDDGRGVDSGRTFGGTQGDAIRNLTGQFALRGTNGGFDSFGSTGQSILGGGQSSTFPSAFGSSGSQSVILNASNQVPTANENRPRNIALLACIKY